MNDVYVKPLETFEELSNRFTYHTPIGNQSKRYEEIRRHALDLAFRLNELCPTSRELSLAITHLEETAMWANAAIARNESEDTNE